MVSFYARDALGLGPLERGVVLACFGAAGFILGRPLGADVQRIGRVPAVIIGALFSAACVAPLGLSTDALAAGRACGRSQAPAPCCCGRD